MDVKTSSGDQIETSIIVRAFNEARHLPALFDAFDRQTYRDFEVIAVDSGSYDDTRRIASERADRLLRISSEDFTFGYSLNVGLREARGQYAVIVSAHTIPDGDDWLETLIAPMKNDVTVAMTYGRQKGVPSSRFSEAEDFERVFGPVPREEKRGHLFVNNANSAIRRDLWLERGFDEALLGLEDIEWATHWIDRGYRVLYEPRAAIEHIHEESWAQIRRRYFREAVSARLFGATGRRHIPKLLIREFGMTLADLVAAFKSTGNPVTGRLTRMQRFREVLYFRFHKNAGSVKGALEKHTVMTKNERHELLFDRPAHAVVIRGPGEARLEPYTVEELTPSSVLIQVAHVAVCATDLEVADGSLGYFDDGLAGFPIVPGHEFSGRIVAVGMNVKDLNEGDRVVVEPIQSCGNCRYCRSGNNIACPDRAEIGVMRRNGAYADYVMTPARFVHRLPSDLDLRLAALTEPLAVVLKGLRRIGWVLETCPKKCAVVGAGPLGHLVAKVLAHRGHSVAAVDRNPARLAKIAGANITTHDDIGDLSEFDVIVEVTGSRDALENCLRATRAGSTHLLLGLPYGPTEFSFETIAAYDKAVVGSVGSAREDFLEAIGLLAELDLAPYFECSMPLSEFKEGWEKSQSGDVLKVILNVA